MLDLVEQWRLIEADFQSHYGLDLSRCRDRTWRWFRVRLAGLLTEETRTARHFAPRNDDNTPGG